MASRLPSLLRFSTARLLGVRTMSTGEFGDGAGKGGGGGGAVRSAGGAFGKMEAAHEEQYFRKLQQEQLEKLKEMVEDEVAHHEQQIRIHQEAIDYHKRKMTRINKQKDSDSD
ncbi:ATPase inhibitor mai-2, mitochondrial [Plakobranchus ocellatus]|uniref:ATP synthase F1 subunit epsilon n=1 Tax=Plakobranchus ocellatus TaxID=259542 RepID=A0AAV4A4N3_9GAST|nr:ATPase inhibitor mai-2, mitochondrial [Plakobranchus ocellatus]